MGGLGSVEGFQRVVMSKLEECIQCAKCGKHAETIKGWFYVGIVQGGECDSYYCSRACLVADVAPELKKAIVVNQWVPTPEEEERMRQ